MGFKKDRYRKARGNYSRVLELSCRVCGKKIAEYQKDGSGSLRRLYLDRIILPKRLTNLSKLKCPNCREGLGTLYIYKKEKRKAFKLYQDALIKKVIKMGR